MFQFEQFWVLIKPIMVKDPVVSKVTSFTFIILLSSVNGKSICSALLHLRTRIATLKNYIYFYTDNLDNFTG